MKSLLSMSLFLLAAGAAAGAPLLPQARIEQGPTPAWPRSFEGRRLMPIAPAPEDALLARSFPGRTARFSDGRRQVVLRQVAVPTRRLHPAGDCFRASGWELRPAPMQMVANAGPASCFIAVRAGRSVRVCERIAGRGGRSWPDISSWYWAALLDPGSGPWLAALTVEPLSREP
jgi:hypothetical protein